MYWLVYLFYYFSIFKRSVTLIKWPCLGVGSLCSVIHRENSGPLQSVLYWSIIRKKIRNRNRTWMVACWYSLLVDFFFLFFQAGQGKKGTDKAVFVEVLTSRNYAQLRATLDAYKTVSFREWFNKLNLFLLRSESYFSNLNTLTGNRGQVVVNFLRWELFWFFLSTWSLITSWSQKDHQMEIRKKSKFGNHGVKQLFVWLFYAIVTECFLLAVGQRWSHGLHQRAPKRRFAECLQGDR